MKIAIITTLILFSSCNSGSNDLLTKEKQSYYDYHTGACFSIGFNMGVNAMVRHYKIHEHIDINYINMLRTKDSLNFMKNYE